MKTTTLPIVLSVRRIILECGDFWWWIRSTINCPT